MAAVDASVTALINGARVVQTKLLIGVQPFGNSIRKPLFAAAGAAAVTLTWRLVPGESLILEGAGLHFGGLTYVAILAVFGLDPEEQHVWERIGEPIWPEIVRICVDGTNLLADCRSTLGSEVRPFDTSRLLNHAVTRLRRNLFPARRYLSRRHRRRILRGHVHLAWLVA